MDRTSVDHVQNLLVWIQEDSAYSLGFAQRGFSNYIHMKHCYLAHSWLIKLRGRRRCARVGECTSWECVCVCVAITMSSSSSSSRRSPVNIIRMSLPKREYDDNFVKTDASVSRFAFCGPPNESEHHEKTLLMEPYGICDYEEYTTTLIKNDKKNNDDDGKRYARVPRTRRQRTKTLEDQNDKKQEEIRNHTDQERYTKAPSSRKSVEQSIDQQQEVYYYDLELRNDALSVSDISMTDDDDEDDNNQSTVQLQCNETLVVEMQSLESEYAYLSSSKKSSSGRKESPSLNTNTRIRRRDDKDKQEGTPEYSYVEKKAEIPTIDATRRTKSRAGGLQRSFSDYPASTFPRRIYRRTQSERNWQNHADLHNQGMRDDRGHRHCHNDQHGILPTTLAVRQRLISPPSPIDTYLASPEWTELQRVKKDWRDFLKENRAKSLLVPTTIAIELSSVGSLVYEECDCGIERAS